MKKIIPINEGKSKGGLNSNDIPIKPPSPKRLDKFPVDVPSTFLSKRKNEVVITCDNGEDADKVFEWIFNIMEQS